MGRIEQIINNKGINKFSGIIEILDRKDMVEFMNIMCEYKKRVVVLEYSPEIQASEEDTHKNIYRNVTEVKVIENALKEVPLVICELCKANIDKLLADVVKRIERNENIIVISHLSREDIQKESDRQGIDLTGIEIY